MAAREATGVKTFQLKRKAGVGFGIALSGGAGQQPGVPPTYQHAPRGQPKPHGSGSVRPTLVRPTQLVV